MVLFFFFFLGNLMLGRVLLRRRGGHGDLPDESGRRRDMEHQDRERHLLYDEGRWYSNFEK